MSLLSLSTTLSGLGGGRVAAVCVCNEFEHSSTNHCCIQSLHG